jgi:putative tricarboxylic transport membrane protein
VKRGWQIASACLLGFFAFGFWAALEFPLLDDLGPGPGFFPVGLSIVGAVLSLALFADVSRAPLLEGAAAAILPPRDARVRTLLVLGFLIAAAFLFEPLGYRLTTLLFIAGLLIALGVRSLTAIVLCSMLGSFGVFHIFYYWLKVPLPIGDLGI